ncbi:MAG: radical SAM family heme chaperone HemW [Patescibacteria group bacterium]|nr:radical SAM family heme chaperone HemW [Patescibacteria group bacterium]
MNDSGHKNISNTPFSMYLHIPFCLSRCIYCNFYTCDAMGQFLDPYVDSLCEEIELSTKKINPDRAHCQSVYFGGGTPSLLSAKRVQQLLNTIRSLYKFTETVEITMECNPQDLNPENVSGFMAAGVNRLSIGCQSFDDTLLHSLSRRHTVEECRTAIELSLKIGFFNISIDLIFGIPGQTIALWERDLNTTVQYSPEHVSVYSLTVEPGTPLYNLSKKGLITLPSESESADMFLLADECLTSAGYEHYEISNYAKPGFHSRHNSAYWSGIPYIGIGAGAHSFANNLRSWNVKDIKKYIALISERKFPIEGTEQLTPEQIFMETVMLSLRTEQGLDITQLADTDRNRIEKNIESLIKNNKENIVTVTNGILTIPHRKWVISDEIIARVVK